MVRLFDNTLRDGGNVVGHGFPISLTQSIIGALLEAGIPDIECGNCKGLGAYAKADAKQAPSDEEYFEAVQPYLSRGRIGMFMLAKLADKELVRGAADAGLYFLRVGADAGDGAGSVKAVAAVKEAGLTCRYSLMKGYVLPAAELAKEANYSISYICSAFRSVMNKTINNYIKEKRLDLAVQYLKADIPITEAAEQAGFNNYSYFYKTFKSVYGISPVEYRNRTLQENDER